MNSLLEYSAQMDTLYPWFWPAVVFVFGACVGSFLNVCIYRIPKGESLIRPGSHNSQGDPIAWYDNIPILSWFILKGKDRKTGEPFSFRYLFTEALTAGLYLFCWLTMPWQFAIVGMVFITLMIPATFIDLDHMLLPDLFTVGGAFAGLILSFAFPIIHGHPVEADVPFMLFSIASVKEALLGMLVGSGMLVWVAVTAEVLLRKEAMGQGDVFLIGAIGAFCGWQGAVFAFFGGSIIGCLTLLPLAIISKTTGIKFWGADEPAKIMEDEAAEEEQPQGLRVPFGPCLIVGALVYYLGFRVTVDGYFDNLAYMLGLY